MWIMKDAQYGGADTSPMSFLKIQGAETCPGDIEDAIFEGI